MTPNTLISAFIFPRIHFDYFWPISNLTLPLYGWIFLPSWTSCTSHIPYRNLFWPGICCMLCRWTPTSLQNCKINFFTIIILPNHKWFSFQQCNKCHNLQSSNLCVCVLAIKTSRHKASVFWSLSSSCQSLSCQYLMFGPQSLLQYFSVQCRPAVTRLL